MKKKLKQFSDLVNPTCVKLLKQADEMRKQNKHREANNLERLAKLLRGKD